MDGFYYSGVKSSSRGRISMTSIWHFVNLCHGHFGSSHLELIYAHRPDIEESMMVRLIIAALACATAFAAQSSLNAAGKAREQSLEQAWSKQLDAQHVTPLERVIALLEKMRAELQAEADKDLKRP